MFSYSLGEFGLYYLYAAAAVGILWFVFMAFADSDIKVDPVNPGLADCLKQFVKRGYNMFALSLIIGIFWLPLVLAFIFFACMLFYHCQEEKRVIKAIYQKKEYLRF